MCKCLCSTAVLLVVQQKCMSGFASGSRDHSNAANHPRPTAQWFLEAGSGSSPPSPRRPCSPRPRFPPSFPSYPRSHGNSNIFSLLLSSPSFFFNGIVLVPDNFGHLPLFRFDGVGYNFRGVYSSFFFLMASARSSLLLSPPGPLNSLPSSSLADSNCFSAYSSSARRASAPSSFTTTFSSASSSFYFIILPLLVGGCLLSCHAIYSRHFATNQFRRARGSIHHRYILFSIRLQSEALDPRSYLLLP